MSEKGKTPHNPASERAVLSGIVQYGKDVLIDVTDIVGIDSFYLESNQIIFRCLEKTLEDRDTVDIPSLLSAASSLGLHEAITDKKQMEYIRSIFNMPIRKENIRSHAKIMAKLQVARNYQSAARSVYVNMSDMTGTENVDDIISKAEGPMLEISTQLNQTHDDKPMLIADGGQEYLQHLIENPSEMVGISTGFPRYDAAIGGGLRRKTVNLIGARPKTGKTTHAKTVAIHIAGKLGIKVLMLDTEMDKKDQFERSLASISRVKTNDISTGKFGQNPINRDKVFAALKTIESIPYYYKNISGKPFEEVLAIIRRWIIQEVGFDENGNTNDCVVIYDYFKLMDDKQLEDMQEYQALGFQISKMADFCNILDFPCLAYVQLNRDGATKDTAEVISQSDRLLWLCSSFSIFRRKQNDEIVANGPANGNMKFIPVECRHGPGLEPNNFINMQMDGDISHIEELTTFFEAQKNNLNTNTGFEVEDDDDEAPPFE